VSTKHEQQLVRQTVYDHFKEASAWPRASQLELMLEDRISDLQLVCLDMGGDFIVCGDPGRHDEICQLRLKALPACEGSEQDIANTIKAIKLFGAFFRRTLDDNKAMLAESDIASEFGFNAQEARRVCLLLYGENGISGGTHIGDHQNQWKFKPTRLTKSFSSINSLADYEDARQRYETAQREIGARKNAEMARAIRGLDDNVVGGRWVKRRRIWGKKPTEVWEATELNGDPEARFAIKILVAKSLTSTAGKRFSTEIEATVRLSDQHPGIVKVVDSHFPSDDEPDGIAYFVMPLAESTLERARDYVGDVEAVLRVGIVVADTLHHAHQQGISHRDIKPANILLYGDARRPVVTDFGICLLSSDERITNTDGGTLGTDHYVAPELLGGGVVDDAIVRRPQVDMYSFGKTLYAAIVGDDPFPREDFEDPRYDLRNRVSDPRVAHLHAVLPLLVAHNPLERLPSMADCKTVLEQVLENVRANMPFQPGMYSVRRTSLERWSAIAKTVATPLSHVRTDAIHDAVSDALDDFGRATAVLRGTPRPSTDSLAALDVVGSARVAGDHLIAAATPLILTGEREALTRILSTATESVRWPSPMHGDIAVHSARQGAGAIALYAIGAVMWRRRRMDLLEELLPALVSLGRNLIHLKAGAGGSLRAWQVVLESLEHSVTLRSADSRTHQIIGRSAAMVSALHMLRVLLPDAAAVAATPSDYTTRTLAFPALYPGSLAWATDLARFCLESRQQEERLANLVLPSAPSELRARCATLTSFLAGYSAQLDREAGGKGWADNWHVEADPDRVWHRWTSSESGTDSGC